MPNWITNKIKAPSHVIKAMLNAEGHLDFNTMAPFPGPAPLLDGVYGDAETAAEAVLGIALSAHPLLGALEAANRRDVNLKAMREDSFEQFVSMLRNYRACGYLHDMDFARKVWGTKRNACRPEHDEASGTAQFETAWNCPEGVLVELSRRFPDEAISVEYADEDVGSNVGEFVLKGGEKISSNEAPEWRNMSDEQREYWKDFAYRVKGWVRADFEGDE